MQCKYTFNISYKNFIRKHSIIKAKELDRQFAEIPLEEPARAKRGETLSGHQTFGFVTARISSSFIQFSCENKDLSYVIGSRLLT